ncbi:hypothetical protein WMW72_18660 [Paenibacillus filicis]|uniref:Uncharacterized protein n=1 Tax=Paenibacillus filicis TaxID=669464 RepID=A0ABU9DQ86_9BACL
MSGFTYQRAYRFKKAALVLLGITLLAAGWKSYLALQTVQAYKQARALQAAGQLPEAEALYAKAAAMPGFDYHKAEIHTALAQLQPIVHMMKTVTALSDSVTAAASAGDAAALAKAYAGLEAAREAITASGAEHAQRFASAVQEAGLEEKLTTGFSNIRKAAEKRLTTAKATEDTGSAAADLIAIPSAYYGGDAAKRKAVNGLLQNRDTARLDSLAKTKPYVEVWKLGEELRTSYERLGWEAAWVAPKLEKLALGSLSILEKQDLPKFLEAARQVKAYTVWAGPGSKIDTYIESVVTGRLQRAAQLSASGKHEDAVALYRTIGAYRDTSKELQAAEQRQLAGDPQKLLTAAGATGKLQAVTGLAPAGGLPQAAALDSTGGKLLLAQLSEGGSPSLHEATLNPPVKKGAVRYSDLSAPDGGKLLLVEGASARRIARYVLLHVEEDGTLRPVLDVEADALSSSGKGELTATRPWLTENRSDENAQPGRGHYKYSREQYELVRTEAAPSLADNVQGNPSGQGEPAKPGTTVPGRNTPAPNDQAKPKQPLQGADRTNEAGSDSPPVKQPVGKLKPQPE